MLKKRKVPEKGTRKLREGRFSGRNQIYHVSTAIRDRQPVFESLPLGRIVVQAMKREDEDLASVARYIVANPVRSGLVKSIRHYSLWDAIWV